jgi:DNA-binding response OmpR family regulator
MRVLVASEDAEVRVRAAGAMRSRAGIEVVEATSAADAHQRLRDDEVDVVVMDGDMRPEGGYSVAYELRAAAELAGGYAPPVIMLMEREQDRWLADWAGAAEALLKPVGPFELADRVAELHRLTGGAVPAPTAGETAGTELAMDDPPELEREEAPPAP